MDQSLKADQRIRDRREFQRVYKKGQSAKGDCLRIWVACEPRTKKPGRPKLGLVISRKTSALATQRNLWKRRTREAFRRLQGRLARNVAVVVQARPQKKVPEFRELAVELEQLLKITGILE